MANLTGFDATQVEPKASYDPIPAGKYLAVITDSEEMPTKAGTGSYLKLTFQIIEGEHKGRLLWTNLNLENQNEKTVQFARAELSAVCHAVGVMVPRDSVELHNLPLVMCVKLAKRKDTGEMENRISKYEKRPAPAVPQHITTDESAPWGR